MIDLLIAQLIGQMLGKAASVTFVGLLFSLMCPIFSLIKLRTAFMAGLMATLVTGIVMGWLLANGEAYNYASEPVLKLLESEESVVILSDRARDSRAVRNVDGQ